MKNIRTKLFIAAAFALIVRLFVSLPTPKNKPTPSGSRTVTGAVRPTDGLPVPPAMGESQSVFVPYWALGDSSYESLPYSRLYYFGVTATQGGIAQDDEGYQGLDRFKCPEKQKCILVVRMLDHDANQEILDDKPAQKKIISQSMGIAEEKGFSGIALDLEMTTISAQTVSGQINDFVEEYYTSAKTGYKSFSFIVYGDVFYRSRPYDIAFISGHSDEIMLMAYDMNKSYGEPGPNFSYEDKKNYGYDFKQMVADFKAKAPSSKITVIFGMYGYNWTMNDQGTPLKQAVAQSLRDIEDLRQETPGAKITVEAASKEKKIEYEDEAGYRHIVWFEDEESASVKAAYLRREGIGNISFWVWGYF